MKKYTRCILVISAVFLLLAMPLLLAKPVAFTDNELQNKEKNITVYSTFGPVYSISELILKNVPGIVHRQLIQPQAGCLRNYQLADWDLYQLAYNADLIIYGGSGLEGFEDVLQQFGGDGPALLEVFYQLEMYGDQDAVSDEENDHFVGINPHIYMSVSSVEKALSVIAVAMTELDPAYASLYDENLQQANAALENLHQTVSLVSKSVSGTKVAIMNEALVYPALEMGLDIIATCSRESGETMQEDTLQQYIQQFSNCNVKAVLIEKQAPTSITEALEAAGFVVKRLDIMNTLSENSGSKAVFEALESNANIIAEIAE